MRLKSFRVTSFRNVVDSGLIPVDESVTCLVGKNEAGKSALLEALYLLNPAYRDSFDVDSQFPTWRLARERRTGAPEQVAPIRGVFELEGREADQIREVLGEEVLLSEEIQVRRRYDSSLIWSIPVDEKRAVENLIGKDQSLPKAVKDAPAFPSLDSAIQSALETMSPGAPQRSRLEKIQEARSEMGGGLAADVAREVLAGGLPKFFKFSNYDTMPGVVILDELEVEDTDAPGVGGMQAARALVKLARSQPEALANENYELRKKELDTVSIDLTQEVFEYWSQNPSLQVEIDVDKIEADIPGGGRRIVRRELHIRVKDTRTGHGSNFTERSTGFQWFFSFLAAFSEFEGRSDNFVVLLDEPGLSLHGRAQRDYLRFIEERLAPVGKVLYSTHSPFMVEADHLERVRVVEDTGPDEWVKVNADASARDPDSLFPLQGALGYDVAQSLFVGPHNLVVEGISDFLFLSSMSALLEDEGRESLDQRWRLLPAGGASAIATFVALVGPHLDTTVLIDSGPGGTNRIEQAINEGLLDNDRLVTIGAVLGRKNADIEDLFEVDDYLNLYNGAFNEGLEATGLLPGNRIVERIERLTGDSFNHRTPARFLLEHGLDLADVISEQSKSNFEKLFNRLNQLLV